MLMFHSRLSSPSHVRRLPERHALCLSLGECSRGALDIAEARLCAGGHVLLDNGAFSLFKRGEAMSVERAGRVLDVYERFAAHGGALSVVAPDVVGDGAATAAIQRALAPRLRALAERCRVIVPVQGFDLEAAAASWRAAVAAIGPEIAAGIPSNKAAWPDDLVRAFALETGCRRMHFLGGSSIARQTLAQELRIEASSDSGYAAMKARFIGRNPAERGEQLAKYALEAERRVAGKGMPFFYRAAQTRWPWALNW